MGSGSSKPTNAVAPSAGSYADVSRSMREYFGISSAAGVYLTGVDAITLPTAFAAGFVIGTLATRKKWPDTLSLF